MTLRVIIEVLNLDDMNNKLQSLRLQIDKIDMQILNILHKRFSVVKEIGEFKKVSNLKPLDINRWNEVLKSRLEISSKLNMSAVFTKKLFDLIHQHSLQIQK